MIYLFLFNGCKRKSLFKKKKSTKPHGGWTVEFRDTKESKCESMNVSLNTQTRRAYFTNNINLNEVYLNWI